MSETKLEVRGWAVKIKNPKTGESSLPRIATVKSVVVSRAGRIGDEFAPHIIRVKIVELDDNDD